MKTWLAVLFVALLATAGCLGPSVSIANWPDGHRAAVIVSFDVEQSSAADLKKVADLLNKYDAQATFFVVAGYYEGVGGILKPLDGFEVANKGWKQGEWSMSPESQLTSIKRSHIWLESNGFKPAGFRAPYLKSNEDTFKVLSDLGYKYDSSKTGLLPTRENNITEVPLSVSYDPFWNENVEEYLPLLYLAFENTYDKEGLFNFYTLPERVTGRWETFLQHVLSKDVWIASAGEVSDWWEKREKVSLRIDGSQAVITNNGTTMIGGLTLKTNRGYILLPRIEAGGTIRVEI